MVGGRQRTREAKWVQCRKRISRYFRFHFPIATIYFYKLCCIAVVNAIICHILIHLVLVCLKVKCLLRIFLVYGRIDIYRSHLYQSLISRLPHHRQLSLYKTTVLHGASLLCRRTLRTNALLYSLLLPLNRHGNSNNRVFRRHLQLISRHLGNNQHRQLINRCPQHMRRRMRCAVKTRLTTSMTTVGMMTTTPAQRQKRLG